MPTLNIKDPEVRELAFELAAQRGTSATGAVREALREALASHKTPRAGLADRLMKIGRAAAPRTAAYLDDSDLYDEAGAPR